MVLEEEEGVWLRPREERVLGRPEEERLAVVADVNYHPIGKYIRSPNILHIYKIKLRKNQVFPF